MMNPAGWLTCVIVLAAAGFQGCAVLSNATQRCSVTDEAVIAYVKQDLKLPTLKVDYVDRDVLSKKCHAPRTWFSDILGCTVNVEDSINVAVDITGRLRVNVTAHEAYHRMQFDTGREAVESSALSYGYKVASQLCGR